MSDPKNVVVFDYGSGNVRSVVRALENVGASVLLTRDAKAVQEADGLIVPGVGAFASVMQQLRDANGPRLIERRLSGARPVLGICVGAQVMFDGGVEHGDFTEGLEQWPGVVERLKADVLPHMGWNSVEVPEGTRLFKGIESERFYFVHSFAAQAWTLEPYPSIPAPLVTWSDHGGRFVAAVENGPLSVTQFHPEKSGEAGAQLLRNWLETL